MTGRRGTWTDVVVIALVVAMTLSILDDTFADRSYLVVGLVPVGILVGMALVTSRMHEGGWWYTLASLVLFSPMGAWVALREPGPWLVPTLDTMGGLLADTVHAPTVLVSTVPPVAPTGVVMLVPFMLGFLTAFPAAWLALGTRRPYAPVVPLGLGLAATIPLGVLVPTLLVPRGVAVALLLVAWAAVRASRQENPSRDGSRSWGSVTTAVLTVALLSGLVALLVPDTDESDRVLLRGDDNTPLVSSASIDLRPQEREGFALLLKARGVPDGNRLRFAVLDLYDGERWVPAEESPGSAGYGTFKRIGPVVAPLHDGRTVVVRVRMQPGYESDWLPLVGELTSIDLDWNPGVTDIGDLRYNQATGSALVLGGVDTRDAYSLESVVTQDTFTRRDATREPSDDQRQPAGASLDAVLQPFDRADLLPLERVLLLARYLRTNGFATKGLASAQTPDDLGPGLLGSDRMAATPFQYSAAMALGASRLGVPARVVTGAPVDRRGLVHNVDVESWVELQFADGTWRPLDARRYVGSRDDGTGDEDVVLPPADEFVKNQIARAAEGKDREIRPPAGSSNPDGTPAVEPRPAWQLLVMMAAAGVVAALLGLLLVPLAKVVRRRRRGRTPSWSGLYVNGWQEVLDAARDRGTAVPEAWSRLAQASALGTGVDLARRADLAVFAPGPGDDPADGREFWDACLALRSDLLREAGVRRRWWARFNPASLLAGWARRRTDRSAASSRVRHEDRRPGGQQPAGA
jgi:hypothetical protein